MTVARNRPEQNTDNQKESPPASLQLDNYEVTADSRLESDRLFFDLTTAKNDDAPGGIRVDRADNLYVSGPGGLWVLSPEGKHLGTIAAPQHIHNMAWGDEDGKTLYLCARSGLDKMRLNIAGVRPAMIAGR